MTKQAEPIGATSRIRKSSRRRENENSRQNSLAKKQATGGRSSPESQKETSQAAINVQDAILEAIGPIQELKPNGLRLRDPEIAEN